LLYSYIKTTWPTVSYLDVSIISLVVWW